MYLGDEYSFTSSQYANYALISDHMFNIRGNS